MGFCTRNTNNTRKDVTVEHMHSSSIGACTTTTTTMMTTGTVLFVVTTENGIEMSSKQILREKIVILANIWCNIFRYLCYRGGFFDPLAVAFYFSFSSVLFFFVSLCLLAKGLSSVFVNRETWKCVFSLYVIVIVNVYLYLYVLYLRTIKAKWIRENARACRKLIIKSQIYNDSNCNNNKHSRWAQCNSFPLLQFLLSSSYSYSFLRCLAFNFHQFLASFPSPSFFASISTFHMAINFLVVFHIPLSLSSSSISLSIVHFSLFLYC